LGGNSTDSFSIVPMRLIVAFNARLMLLHQMTIAVPLIDKLKLD
jgi:hypothetical protein